MKTFTSFCLFMFFFSIIGYCQKPTIDLTFTALNNNQYVPIDSICIENLTQELDTILYSPDTILSLEYQTSINDIYLGNSSFYVSQNYPNPFKDNTTIEVNMEIKDDIKISICDITGREVAQYSGVLCVGKHIFSFYPAREMYYFLFAKSNNNAQTIKMINLSHSRRTFCKVDYVGMEPGFEKFKSQSDFTYFDFNLGDQLRFMAYAKTINSVNGSNIIEDAPTSNKTYVFNISEGVPCPNEPFVTYENQVYATIQIGGQCWLKENLNIGNPIYGYEAMEDNGIIEKYCFGNLLANCEIYGGLYQWDEMMAYSTEQGAKGICPLGWHVPTDNDWYTLETYLDPTINEPLIFGWRGTIAGTQLKNGGSSGFNALLEGRREHYSGIFNFFGTSHYWSSTQYLSNVVYRRLEIDKTSIGRMDCDKNYGFPVRCIKDEFSDPPKPEYPIPENGAIGIDTNLTLQWKCNNSVYDTIFYNIYFGTSNDPPLVATNIQDTLYNPGILNTYTIYYWKVISFNNEGDSTSGPIWSFQTVSTMPCNSPLIDIRDGQSYSTILIGDQCWMGENLNIGTRMDGVLDMVDNGIIEKYCYDDLEYNCDTYGGMYQWNELMDYSIIEGTQGICPVGWHVPTDMEWFEMASYLDPTYTDPNIQGWQGTTIGTQLLLGGSSGFEALLSGYRKWDTGGFSYLDDKCLFWTSTIPTNSILSWYRLLEDGNPQFYRNGCEKLYGFPIRCIKD